MTVEVFPLNILGGAGKPPVTRVTDTFARGTLNPPGQVTWMHNVSVILPIINNITFGLAFCNGVNQIVLSNQPNGVISTYFSTLLLCVGLTTSAVYGLKQYCQSTFQGFANAGAFGACGNMVMGKFDGENGAASWYGIAFRTSGGNPVIERCVIASNILTNTILFTDSVAAVAGDVWRLSFDPSTNTVTGTKNGSVVYSAVDGSPLSGGIPGYNMRTVLDVSGNGAQIIMSNLDCGLGL
jgi:hypothetical protein